MRPTCRFYPRCPVGLWTRQQNCSAELHYNLRLEQKDQNYRSDQRGVLSMARKEKDYIELDSMAISDLNVQFRKKI